MLENKIVNQVSLETRRKISQNRKGKGVGAENPAKRTDVRKKISMKLKGRVLSEEWRRKISRSLSGKKHSEETKRKMGNRKRSEDTKKKLSKAQTGRKYSEDTKRKMRESAFEYIRRTSNIICPRIGKNEKKILDNLEHLFGYKIDRKFKIEGYFPDGYIHELNLIIEVDERPKNSKKEVEREKIIRKTLNCKFLRIEDYV